MIRFLLSTSALINSEQCQLRLLWPITKTWEHWDELLILISLKIQTFQQKCNEWKAIQSAENCQNGSLAKVAKFHTNPYKFVACLPNPYKLSILGDTGELPFCYFPPPNTSIRGEDLVDLSFEYLSFSNKKKTTILFLSPLTFLLWHIIPALFA